MTDPIDELCRAIEAGTPPPHEILAADVTLDATVPDWRVRRRGADAVRDQLAAWYAWPARFEELERIPLARGALLVFTLAWEERGAPYAARQAHIVTTEGGRITSITAWSGGRWNAALLAEMGASPDAD